MTVEPAKEWVQAQSAGRLTDTNDHLLRLQQALWLTEGLSVVICPWSDE